MANKKKTDIVQINTRIDAEIESMWRGLFGTQKSPGKESLSLRQATETAMQLFAAMNPDARYYFSNNRLDAEFWERFHADWQRAWPELRERLNLPK